jgi:hypothetical protein
MADCCLAECRLCCKKYLYTQCHYAEYHYHLCLYAESHGAELSIVVLMKLLGPNNIYWILFNC